ncbi:MAG: ATP-binding protein [Solobacterium sp.]|nr:ATP-binding protein [Solobacterium sp.]
MEIKRNKYLNELIRRKENGLIKVVTGIRRSGKSYLLFNIYRDYLIQTGINEKNIITVPLDDYEFSELCDPGKLYKYIQDRITENDQTYYIFIDEAQYAISKAELKNPDSPIRLYGVLNGLLRRKNTDIYITGSNSRFLSSDILTEFRGRGDEVHIAPLSFSEYFPVSGKDKYDSWKDYLVYGGLPHILAEPDEKSKSAYLEQLNNEIYLKDIVERHEIRDEAGMDALMKVLASSIGSLTNPQKIADTFNSAGIKGITMPTISKYLIYLQESFIIQKSERYDVKGRRYIGTPSKYYYTDSGLRNALLNFRQYEESHLMENAIYNELIYRGFHVDVGVVETRSLSEGKNTRKQLEVDFVVNKGSERYYIQSALALPTQEKIDQEQASLIKIPDSFKKLIITSGNTPVWRNEQGITFIGLFDFLLNENSLMF